MATNRVVCDTNVVVSAVLLPRSISRQAFDVASESGRLLLSEETLAELDEVLRREKFDPYLSEKQRLEFLLALVNLAELVPVSCVIRACRDPRDNKFLEVAIDGAATHIVTGDADLLAFHPFQNVAIVNPRAFLTGL